MRTLAPSYPSAVPTLGRIGYVSEIDGYQITPDLLVVDAYGTVDPDKSAVLRQIEANAPGTVASAQSSSFDWNSMMNNLTELVGVALQGKAQHDLLQANIERAKQGLPPLNAQQYMPGVNVGVSNDTKNTLYILAAMGLGAVILPQLMGGGRRGRRR